MRFKKPKLQDNKLGKRLLLEEHGIATIIIAAALVALMGITALVTDAGFIYLNKSKIVNTLDSAVLAGAQELPSDPREALNIAASYALANGMENEEFEFDIGADGCSVIGIAQRRVGLFFAKTLGFEHSDINFSATARVAPITAVSGLAPFGVLENNFTFGEDVILKQGAANNYFKGWFGCLRLGGPGADIYRDNIKFGFQGNIRVGDIIPVEDGNDCGPTRTGVEYCVAQCHHSPKCTADSFVEGCRKIVLIPIIRIHSINEGGAVSQVKVVSFAAFLIQDYVGTGNENAVKGCFIQYHISGTPGEGVPDYGLYGVTLCE